MADATKADKVMDLKGLPCLPHACGEDQQGN